MNHLVKRSIAALLAAAMLCGPGSALAVCAEEIAATPETAAGPLPEDTLSAPIEEPDENQSEESDDSQSVTGDLSELLPGEQGTYTIGQDENGEETAALSLRGGSELEDAFTVQEITPNEDAQPLDMSDYEEGWDALGQAVTSETGVDPEDLAALVQAADATHAALNAPLLLSEESADAAAVLPVTENDWSAVEIVESSTNAANSRAAGASAVLYMIDNTHTLIRVVKEDGNPLDGATVTIQLKDENGNLIKDEYGNPVTQTVVTASKYDHGVLIPDTGGTAVF